MKARFARFAPESRPAANARPSYLSRRYAAERAAQRRADMLADVSAVVLGGLSAALLGAALLGGFILAHGGAPAFRAVLSAMGVA